MNLFSMSGRTSRGRRCNAVAMAGALALALCAALPAWAQQDTDAVPTRVGRLSNLAGQIYLSPQDHADDWSPIALNYPVTSGDNLWASDSARAEFDFGGSQLRMSAATSVTVANLDDHNIDLFVAQGEVIVRFNPVDAGDSVVIDTPTTQVVLVQPGLYRIGVSPDQQQTTLTIRAGEATAQVTAGLQQVLAGMTAVIDNGPQTAAEFSAARPLDAFDTWNADRERYFNRAAANNFVSPEMVGYADLSNYGAWQSEPDYGNVWYPTNVASGWAPYSDGYWTTVSGFGLTWVDRAPWGYAPFHYGRWAHIHNRWGWLPGDYVARPVWAPALVAWTGGGVSISVAGGGPVYGWVPLGYREPYRPWWNGCSGSCWDRYNRPYRVDERERDRYRNQAPPPDRYANWRVPGAVTAVAGNRLIARKPYTAGERVALTGTALSAARPAASAPAIVKPSPNRIATVRPGSRGTPPPASAFYATSKPAQMGLSHPGTARLMNQKFNNQTILNATGTAPKPTPSSSKPGAGSSSDRLVRGAPPATPAQAHTAPGNPGNVGVPMLPIPANAAKAPTATTGVAPRIGGTQSRPQNEQHIVTPQPGAGGQAVNGGQAINGNAPPPRMQVQPHPQAEPRIVTPPRVQTESRVINQAPKPQVEPRIVNQAPRLQTEQRVAPLPGQPQQQQQQQVIRVPQPQPQPQNGAQNRDNAPRAASGNQDRGRAPTKLERDKDNQQN